MLALSLYALIFMIRFDYARKMNLLVSYLLKCPINIFSLVFNFERCFASNVCYVGDNFSSFALLAAAIRPRLLPLGCFEHR